MSMLKRTLRLSATLIAAPLAVLLHSPPVAATPENGAPANSGPSSNALEEVTVLGQRTTPEIARAAQQQAPNLINLTTSEEMQKLPDVNTGEAIRRVPGISLETDTGEGRYINIRGLDADLNSTTFGGLRLPPTNNSSPSGAGCAVAFDSIPIGFVGAIKVTKSNLPEQDAEALGGTRLPTTIAAALTMPKPPSSTIRPPVSPTRPSPPSSSATTPIIASGTATARTSVSNPTSPTSGSSGTTTPVIPKPSPATSCTGTSPATRP